MRYYLISGEASGDRLCDDLMQSLRKCDGPCEFRRWRPERSVMGVWEVAAQLPRLVRELRTCRNDIAGWKPDAVVLVDYPAFNLRIARFAHSRGFKVYWYVAPKAWAHGEGRVESLRRDVDRVYCIFPFEPEWFRFRGLEVRYFGNPLADILAREATRPLEGGRMIALLPGSRRAELSFLMPRFAEMERLMDASGSLGDLRLVVAGAPGLDREDYERHIPAGSRMEVVFGRTADLLGQAEAAVVCSGTASLEAALSGVPQLVCYGFSSLTWKVARKVVKVPYASLVNLILGREAVPELLQDAASPEGMLDVMERILTDESMRSRMQADYAEMRAALGGPGASMRVAEDICKDLESLSA